MKPLRPDDLLIRKTPVDQARWTEMTLSGEPGKKVGSIRLERFQELEQLLRNNPVDSSPYIELARIYLHQERWQDAKRVLDRAAEQFGSDEEVLHLREEALLARSLQLLDAAEREYLSEPTILTEQTLKRSKLELCAMREKVCRARLSRHPDQLELTIPLADALDGLDRSEEAVEYLEKAVAEPSLRAFAGLKLGELLEKHGQIPEALSAYRRASLFRVPTPPEKIRLEALGRAAELARKHDMIDSAARYVQMIRLLDPQNPRWQHFAEELAALETASNNSIN